jgi:hypothetical protein
MGNPTGKTQPFLKVMAPWLPMSSFPQIITWLPNDYFFFWMKYSNSPTFSGGEIKLDSLLMIILQSCPQNPVI